MLSFFLLILCLNIDALSYGIAYGIKKIKFKIPFILCLSLLSTLMFALPLFFSKYIYMYFDEFVLRIVNAIILIILGIKYVLTKPQNFKKIHKKYVKLFKNNKKINNLKNNTLNYYENKILINKIKFKTFYFDNKKSFILTLYCRRGTATEVVYTKSIEIKVITLRSVLFVSSCCMLQFLL